MNIKNKVGSLEELRERNAHDETFLKDCVISRRSRERIRKIEKKVHNEIEQEGEEAPINIHWRKSQSEPILQTAAHDFDAAERKRDELIKAGCIDIQIIVKGKKKEVTGK